MIKLGLTGSIASGKTEAAKIFRARGIPVFDSDAEVHRLYDSKEGADLVSPFVPQAVIDNKVDRKILSHHVLADPVLLSKLEKHVHAEIATRREIFTAETMARNQPLILYDIPLLFETGADKQTDATLVISVDPEIQRQRALARPGMTEERLAAILARQMPNDEKCQRASYVITNNGSLKDYQMKLETLIDQLTQKASTNA
jgi:dephospho-CoA kinase